MINVWDFYHDLSKNFKAAFVENGIFVIMIDEVPVDGEDLALIEEILDVLKFVGNVILILFGTNSNAAKKVTVIFTGQNLSSVNQERKWSFMITHLPKDNIEYSSFSNSESSICKI
jgi:hypothetical protein